MQELKRELELLRPELLQRYQADADADAERVVQLNFQMFPLSRKKEGVVRCNGSFNLNALRCAPCATR